MIRPAILTLALAGTLLGSDERDQPAASAGPAPKTTARTTTTAPAALKKVPAAMRGKTIKAVKSRFGRILADGRGQAVYVFDRETSSKPACYGACAKAWPPVLTKGRPVAGRGARAAGLGTTRRRGGARQATVDGRPLYYYIDDAPGQVLCHNVDEFGGLWLVVRPDGTPVS